MDDLVTWLRAQLDEDERVARGVEGERWYFDFIEDGKREYEDRFGPARALAEVAAKRAIVDDYVMWDGWAEFPNETGGMASGLETAVEYLAAVYSDRAGYREEWRA